MTDTYCGLLNVLILGILAGINGLEMRQLRSLRRRVGTRVSDEADVVSGSPRAEG